MMKFTIPYKITEEDYLEFNDYFIRCTSEGKKILFLFRIIAPIASLSFIIVVWLFNGNLFDIMNLAILLSIISIISIVCAPRVILNITKKQLKISKKSGQSLYSSEGIMTFEFDDKKITDKSESIELKIDFKQITTYHKTNDAYYFYFSHGQGIILPCRSFENDKELKEFENLVDKNFCH